MKIDSTYLPNGLTFLNCFFGFLSIIFALGGYGHIGAPAMYVMMAAVFDMIDGRIARAIKRENPLGLDFDSFADLITFGVAPAIYFFSFFFTEGYPYYDILRAPFIDSTGEVVSNVYWLLFFVIAASAFIYTTCAAVRLARFNNLELKGFSGFPSPLSAGLVVMTLGFPYIPTILFDIFLDGLPFYAKYDAMNYGTYSLFFTVPFFFFCAFIMISRIEFNKPKWFLSFGKSIPKPLLALNILMFLGIVFTLQYALIIMTLVYLIPSLIKFKLVDRELVTFEHKLKEKS